MPVDTVPVPAKPMILATLGDPPVVGGKCPRRTQIDLDLLLLALEALDVNGPERMLAALKELELTAVVPGRVDFWVARSTNPLRLASQRRPLTLEEAKAMTLMICHLAKRMTVLIRQLLMGYQQLSDRQLSFDHHFRLGDYLSRFRSHFRARMNPQRAGVIAYSQDEKLDALALNLLQKLLFSTGTQGCQRLWWSLFDGEVA